MQEIKDEDRIIGRICRGELSITNDDIKNLANADLDEAHEENFRKLAQEINETLDRNQSLRKEMKEKVAAAEKQCGDYLEIIDEEIEYLQIKSDKLRYGSNWSMMLGAMIFLASGFIPCIIAGMFTEALWVMVTATFLGAFTSLGFMLYHIYRNSLKRDELDKKIKQLETKKLTLIEQSQDLELTEENEIKTNILKNINNARSFEVQQKDGIEFEITL